MFLSGYYIFITSPNWQSHSTSDLVNLISLAVTVAIVFILLEALAAGGLALTLSVVFLIRYLLEGSVSGIQLRRRLSPSNSTGQMRNLEAENKTAADQHGSPDSRTTPARSG